MKESIYKLLNYLKKSKRISYVTTITAGENISDLVKKKKNTINIELGNIRIFPIVSLNNEHGERHTYKFVIQFFTPDKIRKYALFGFKNKKGLWDLAKDIWETLKEDKTIGEYFLPMETAADTISQTFKLKDCVYIAGAEMIITLSKDFFFKKEDNLSKPLFAA